MIGRFGLIVGCVQYMYCYNECLGIYSRRCSIDVPPQPCCVIEWYHLLQDELRCFSQLMYLLKILLLSLPSQINDTSLKTIG